MEPTTSVSNTSAASLPANLCRPRRATTRPIAWPLPPRCLDRADSASRQLGRKRLIAALAASNSLPSRRGVSISRIAIRETSNSLETSKEAD